MSGQSYFGQSGSDVLQFGFKINCLAHTDIRVNVVPLRAKQALGGGGVEVRFYTYSTSALERGGRGDGQRHAPEALPPAKIHCTHCIRCGVGLRAATDGSGKSRPHLIYINNYQFLFSFPKAPVPVAARSKA